MIGVDRSVYVNFDTRQVAVIEPRYFVEPSVDTCETRSVIGSTDVVPTTEYDAFLGKALKNLDAVNNRKEKTTETRKAAGEKVGSRPPEFDNALGWQRIPRPLRV